jgi:hypothetical protein
MMTPLLAYGAGLGTAAAYVKRDWLKQQYQAVMNKALASSDPKAVAKVAVAFGAAGMPGQAAALRGHAQNLAGAGTPNVLKNPSRMMPGETLQPQLDKQNHSVGRDSRGTLTFQVDGNLVLYGPGQTVLWASNTGPKTGVSKLTMQADGNLVIYGNNGKALWSSGTQGNPGAYLTVQGGSATIRGGQGGQVLWSVPGAGQGAQPAMPGAGLGLPGGPGMRGHYPHPPNRHEWNQAQMQPEPEWHHLHHYPHPWQGQASMPQAQYQAPMAPSPSMAPSPMAPPPMMPDTSPDVSAASMISPSIAQDSGGASDAALDTPPDDDSSDNASSSDAGFGFGCGSFG